MTEYQHFNTVFRLAKISIYKAKLTNKELAERVGISAPNMSAIVNGAIPHLRTAQKIVRELNKVLPEEDRIDINFLWPLPEGENK